jgi:hypothetical protein
MNRISKFLGLGFLSVGLIAACGSSNKSVAVNAPPPPAAASSAPAINVAPVVPAAPKDGSVTVSGAKWSYVLPNSSWEQADASDSTILSLARNKQDKIVILFMAQPFEGPADVFPLVVLSGVKDAGGTIASVEATTINGVVFAHAVTSAKGANAHMWIAVKDGMGYDWMCGGPDSMDQTATCTAIAATLQLK